MAFEIYRTNRTVSGQSSNVIADYDISTGGRQAGRAISEAGSILMSLGEKWELQNADTQFTKAKAQAREEHNKFLLSLESTDPDDFQKLYEESIQKRKLFNPKNQRASKAYNNWLTSLQPFWNEDKNKYLKAKITDDFRAAGFSERQKFIETGNSEEYFSHLEKGVLLGSYSKEEAAKYRQYAIDDRMRFATTQTALAEQKAKEELELKREEDRDEISKLIRAGEIADNAIEASSLDEAEQFTWFERQRREIERKTGIAKIQETENLELRREEARGKIAKLIREGKSVNDAIGDSPLEEKEKLIWYERQRKGKDLTKKEQLELKREEDRADIAKLIREGKSADKVIDNSLLEENEKFTWYERQRLANERRRQASIEGMEIVNSVAKEQDLLDMAASINWPDQQMTPNEVKIRANEARFGKVPTIDDAAYARVRAAIRKAEEDKMPFTEKYIEQVIGEIMTGAPSSILGFPLPTLPTREDAMKHATNSFGRYLTRVPGVMDTINAKYPPRDIPREIIEDKGEPAYDFDGELIGSFNPDGSITLNNEGARRLWELAGRDKTKAREMARQNRYVLPEIK